MNNCLLFLVRGDVFRFSQSEYTPPNEQERKSHINLKISVEGLLREPFNRTQRRLAATDLSINPPDINGKMYCVLEDLENCISFLNRDTKKKEKEPRTKFMEKGNNTWGLCNFSRLLYTFVWKHMWKNEPLRANLLVIVLQFLLEKKESQIVIS